MTSEKYVSLLAQGGEEEARLVELIIRDTRRARARDNFRTYSFRIRRETTDGNLTITPVPAGRQKRDTLRITIARRL